MTITTFKSNLTDRRRYLALGAYRAATIREVRARGIDAALELVDTLGGVTQRRTLARDVVALVARLDDVPAYRIDTSERVRWQDGERVEERMVSIPSITWTYRGRRQRARLEWLPMFGGVTRRLGRAVADG